jgi:hypothetical protein
MELSKKNATNGQKAQLMVFHFGGNTFLEDFIY